MCSGAGRGGRSRTLARGRGVARAAASSMAGRRRSQAAMSRFMNTWGGVGSQPGTTAVTSRTPSSASTPTR